MDLPGRASVSLLGSGVHVNGEVLAPAFAPPTRGEHTNEVLADLGYSLEEIERLRDEHVI